MDKVCFTMEYDLGHLSTPLLWSYITTESGLSQWFADEVRACGKEYTFVWAKQPSTATLINQRQGHFVRFRWQGEPRSDKSYFELRITHNELTSAVALLITDYASPDEVEENRALWNRQIESLSRVLGL